MNLNIVPYHRNKEILGEDRMLFVRTNSIWKTMVKIPLLAVSMIIVVATMPIQPSFGSPRNLDLIIYPDGSTHVSAEIHIDSLATDYELDLFGSTIDNFVVVGENGFLLDSTILGDSALIETFGSSVITVEYDIHDLVSKQGKVWTFSLRSPTDFTLLLPQNTAIVSMTNLPINMEIVNDHNQLTLAGGSNSTEIDYLFSTGSSPSNTTIPQSDYLMYAIVGIVIATATVVIILVIIRGKQQTKAHIEQQPTISKKESNEPKSEKNIDIETIFKLKPDIRQDDKEIVKFIFDKGGEVFESELRKKFLQPRTTMWRAVKRLERNDIIEIQKKDLQNLVKIRKNMIMEEEEEEK